MSILRKQLVTLTAAATLAMPMAAMATNGILPLGNGMVAHGFGGAGMANGAETMSAVDNPALASQVGNQWAVGASLFNPNRSASVNGTTYVESDDTFFIIPQGGWLTKSSDNLNWGVLAYAMGGMSTNYPAALTGTASSAELQGMIVAPTMSYKTGASGAVGVSLLIGYETLETTGSFGGNNSDSATGYGFKLGYTHDISPDTSIGIIYQSVVEMDKMDKHCNGGILSGVKAAGHDCALSMPEMYGLGIKQKLGADWKLVADILQVNWTSVDVFKYGFQWEDQTIYKVGAELALSSESAIRFGYNHGDSPVPDSKVAFNLAAPAVTEDHFTVGYSRKLSGGAELTGYYAYVPENEQKQNGPVPTGYSSVAKVKMDQNALGIGYNVRF